MDGGYDKAKQSLNNYVFRKYLNFNKLLEEEIDFKSKLFIWCQRKKLNLDFLVVKEYQENSQWNYEIKVIINHKEFGRGVGLSKKTAEQEAAKQTLHLIGEI